MQKCSYFQSERKGGGLAIIYRSNLEVKRKTENQLQSMHIVKWKIETSSKIVFTVNGVYHPPYSEKNPVTNSIFLDEFTQVLADSATEDSNNIILGDVNIHLNDKSDHNAEVLNDTLQALGLIQHVDFYTHTAGNILDVVITEAGSNISVTKCVPGPFLSDHRAVVSVFNVPKEEVTTKLSTFRKLRKIDHQHMQKKLSEFKIPKDCNDIDTLVQQLESNFKSVLDEYAPLQSKKLTIRKKNPWFTDIIKEQKLKVRRRERVWNKYQLDSTLTALKFERAKYNCMLKQSKINTISEKVRECGTDTKKLYSLISEITSATKDNPLPKASNEEDLANEFAKYFMNKIQTIRDSLDKFQPYEPSENNNITVPFNTFKPLTEEEVITIINKMSAKSCEIDAMPTTVLKKVLPGVITNITKVINMSLTDGKFPRDWKVAIIRPLLKKPGLELVSSNYRPVSNLPFLSKVLEKAALYQFNRHTNEYGLMPDYQSAYRENYSCETALIKLLNDLLWAMEQQKVTAMMAIDLSAAFDTVDHSILLSVLSNKFNIKGAAMKWFDSYLRPRSCRVNIGEKYSEDMDLQFSVPQGSCAGPILYLAYASTMKGVIPSDIQLHGYADDHITKCSFKSNDQKEEKNAIINLENCANNIKKWMDGNRLRMNTTKTDFIMFGNLTQLAKCTTSNLCVNGDNVKGSEKVKYLGTWLDKQLNLKCHITTKCRTAMYNIHRIKQIRHMLTVEATHKIVLGLVMSHIDYCNGIMYGLPETSIKKLQCVQNIAAKLILKQGKYDSATEARKTLHWLPIRARIEYKILTLVYKCLEGNAPEYLKELITIHVPIREGLRSNERIKILKVPFTRYKTFAWRSFSISGPTLWNGIPDRLKLIENFNVFKINLKTYLFDKYYN